MIPGFCFRPIFSWSPSHPTSCYRGIRTWKEGRVVPRPSRSSSEAVHPPSSPILPTWSRSPSSICLPLFCRISRVRRIGCLFRPARVGFASSPSYPFRGDFSPRPCRLFLCPPLYPVFLLGHRSLVRWPVGLFLRPFPLSLGPPPFDRPFPCRLSRRLS